MPILFGFGILMWLAGSMYVPGIESPASAYNVPLILSVILFFISSFIVIGTE